MTTLAEAIEKKYVEASDEDDEGIYIIFAPRPSDRLPATLVLNDTGIQCVGDLRRVKELCFSTVRELDLAQNNITDFGQVIAICNALPRLSFLNLSSNDLSHGGSNCSSRTSTVNIGSTEMVLNCRMDNMRRLVMNGTYISWNRVHQLISKMHNLQEMYLSLNGFDSVVLPPERIYPSMKLLHFSGNPVDSWQDVCNFGRAFPNLELLVMTDCNIRQFDQPDKIKDYFPHLESLNITNNQIRQWSEVDKFCLFPALREVRMLGLPLFDEYNELERRQLAVGRLPNIVRLNGSFITDDERTDSERACVRYYRNRPDKPPRYHELVAKHGELQPLAEVDLSPQMKAHVMVQFQDKFEDKVVKLDQTVYELKHSLQGFTGLSPSKMRLFYMDKDLAVICGPEELRVNNKKLYSYCINDGDQFIIDKKG